MKFLFSPLNMAWGASNEPSWLTEYKNENHFQIYAPSNEKNVKNLQKMVILGK